MPAKLTLDDVKSRANQYGATVLSDSYEGIYENILFVCKCGKKFKTSFYRFINSRHKSCRGCSKKTKDPEAIPDVESLREYIEQNSKCKLLSTVYTSVAQKIKLQCACGNVFNPKFNNFKRSKTKVCNSCSRKNAGERRAYDFEYVKDYIESNSDSTLVSKTYSRTSELLTLECSCGKHYRYSFRNFLGGYGRVCNRCLKRISSGEAVIKNYLNSIHIPYEREFYFNDLRGLKGRHLRFDFALFDKNKTLLLLVEFDGEQHYKRNHFGDMPIIQEHDRMKNEYCLLNNIQILRIQYHDMKNVSKIIDSKLIELNYDNTEPSQEETTLLGRCNDQV